MALSRQPALTRSTALAKALSTEARLAALIPVLAAIDSPVGEFLAVASEAGEALGNGTADHVLFSWFWADPVTYTSQVVEWRTAAAEIDPSTGQPDQAWAGGVTAVQVEVAGGGGGGGGGGAVSGVNYGGGGGGGGEYQGALEYPIVPGRTYTVLLGLGGNPGFTNAPGGQGCVTVFDPQGAGKAGGVVAMGGHGGGDGSTGNGGQGGLSSWSAAEYAGTAGTDASLAYGTQPDLAFPGGEGGTEVGGIGTDSPGVLGITATTQLWWPLDDYDINYAFLSPANPSDVLRVKDHGTHNRTGTVTQNTDRAVAGNGIMTGLLWQKIPDGTGSITTPFDTVVVPEPAIPEFRSTTGEFPGSFLLFINTGSATCARVQAPSFTFAPSAFTVSCWVQNDPTQPDWGDTGGSSVLITNNGGTSSGTFSTAGGFSLIIDGGNKPSLFVANSGTGFQVTSASVVPQDSAWHQVVATFSAGTVKIYLDGAQVASSTSGSVTSVSAGSVPVTLGCYPNFSKAPFGGYLANAWLATTAINSTQVQTAFGTSTPPTGGAGGGASGGAGGVNGASGAGSTGSPGSVGTGGAAGPAANAYAPTTTANPALLDLAPIMPVLTGSAAGGHGGNAGAAGSTGMTASPWAGGGGGAGYVSAASFPVKTRTCQALASASFCGIDASGGNGGKLLSTSIAPQDGIPSPYPAASITGSSLCYQGGQSSAAFNGTTFTVAAFTPLSGAIPGSGTAPVPVSCALALTVQSTAAFVLGVWAAATSFFGADGTTGAPEVPLVLTDAMMTALAPVFTGAYYVPAGDPGRQVSIDILSSALAGEVITAGAPTTLLFGPMPGFTNTTLSDLGGPLGAYDTDTAADWFAHFTGAAGDATSMSLTLSYVDGGGPGVTAGAGGQGYCAISVIQDGSVITSMTSASPYASGEGGLADTALDNIPVGLATRLIQTWSPATPTAVETWNNLGNSGDSVTYTLKNGWILQSGNPARFKKMPDGSVWLQFTINGASKTGNTFFTLPSGYFSTTTQQQVQLATFSGSATTAIGNLPYVQVDTNGDVVLTNPWPWSSDIVVNGFISVI